MDSKESKLKASLQKAQERSERTLKSVEKHYKKLEKEVLELKTKHSIDITKVVLLDYKQLVTDATVNRVRISSKTDELLKTIGERINDLYQLFTYGKVTEEEHDQLRTAYLLLHSVSSSVGSITNGYLRYLENELIVAGWQEKLIKEQNVSAKTNKIHPAIEASLTKWARHTYHLLLSEGEYNEKAALKYIADERRKKEVDLSEQLEWAIGSVEKAIHVHVGWKGQLSGYFQGTGGTAKVETIEAGGYNVQRWHLRTLVHRLKDNTTLDSLTHEQIIAQVQVEVTEMTRTIKQHRELFNTKVTRLEDIGYKFPTMKLALRYKNQYDVYMLAKDFYTSTVELNPFDYQTKPDEGKANFNKQLDQLCILLRRINAFYILRRHAESELDQLKSK